MRKIDILLLKLSDNLSKDSITALTHSTLLELIAIKFFKVNLHTIVKLIKMFHSDGNAKSIEHIINLISRQATTTI